MANVKITVVKKVNNKDIFGDNSPLGFTSPPECDKVELGQGITKLVLEPLLLPWA